MSVRSIEYDVNEDRWITTGAEAQPPAAPDARAVWRQAVATVAERAKAALPACNGRVEAAVKIVLAGDVELLADGSAKVASQSNGSTTYY
jgi:hypothetical protein